MHTRIRLIAIAILVGSPVVAACAGEDAGSPQPRQPNIYASARPGIAGPDTPMTAAPVDMPGKGRGTEPLKGKP